MAVCYNTELGKLSGPPKFHILKNDRIRDAGVRLWPVLANNLMIRMYQIMKLVPFVSKAAIGT